MAVLRNRRPPMQDAPWLHGPSLNGEYMVVHLYVRSRRRGVNASAYSSIKTGIFDQPEAKVHLGQVWRIGFSYKDIRDYWGRLKGRVRGAAPRTRPFDRPQYS